MSIVTGVETDVLNVIGDRVRPIIEGDRSGGMFEVFVVEGEQGSGPPPHAHPWVESFYVLEGRLTIEMGDEKAIAEPGESALVPAGQVHRFEVVSPKATFMVVTGGDNSSKFFRDLSASAPGVPTPESLPGIIEVAKRNGLTSPLF